MGGNTKQARVICQATKASTLPQSTQLNKVWPCMLLRVRSITSFFKQDRDTADCREDGYELGCLPHVLGDGFESIQGQSLQMNKR